MRYRAMMTQDDGLGEAMPSTDREGPVEATGIDTIECYDVDEELVLYDSENPLAWVRTDYSVTLEDNE